MDERCDDAVAKMAARVDFVGGRGTRTYINEDEEIVVGGHLGDGTHALEPGNTRGVLLETWPVLPV